MKILFLHDTFLELKRGAELSINQLISAGREKNHIISANLLSDFESLKDELLDYDAVVICNTSRCRFEKELYRFILENHIPYFKLEYDYNFCIRRNVLCTVDRTIRNCCDVDKFHIYREVFRNSLHNFFQSPRHYEIHFDFYGEAVDNYTLLPPSVEVGSLNPKAIRNEDTIPFFGDLNYLKGGYAYVDFASRNPDKQFKVFGRNQLKTEIPPNVSFFPYVENDEVLEILGETRQVFLQPVWPEPSGRLAAEAFLSGCEVISNDRIGTFTYDFYPHDKERAKEEMSNVPNLFWDRVGQFLQKKKPDEGSLGNVLAYKSYGGLGDLFFLLPALKLLNNVSQSLTFAVEKRRVSFFSEKLPEYSVISEDEAASREGEFDNVYEFGNYPAFRGYDLPHALRYITHKKVKQHAIGHYKDCVARLHPGISPADQPVYPYFNSRPDVVRPYYTLHAGAGFLLKIWPTEKYAELIRKIHDFFPGLGCKIIMGPNDPDPTDFLPGNYTHIEKVTGGMEDVGHALESALFHIGNDAGITHFAGAYNLPIVAIYGPTGPGSWGAFSEKNKIIWGKTGTCDLRCNYDVILNCSHKICLSSITPERVFSALLQLLNELPHVKQSGQYMFDPYLKITEGKGNFILKNDTKEFLLEFKNPAEFSEFKSVETLFQPETITSAEVKNIIEFLVQEQMIFRVPEIN